MKFAHPSTHQSITTWTSHESVTPHHTTPHHTTPHHTTPHHKLYLAAFIAFFGMLAVGTSHASCTGSNRVSLGSASCLDGGWENTCQGRIFGHCTDWHSSYWAQPSAECVTGTDKVVVKVDLKGTTDRTAHQTTTAKVTGTSDFKVNGVYCCNDLGRCN